MHTAPYESPEATCIPRDPAAFQPLASPATLASIHLLTGNSAVIRAVMQQLELVAPYNSTVLLTGETGTGKEVAARAVHTLSPRRVHPFVAVNCGAIPADLLESELFGHEKGAFTGAIALRRGRFELAEHGTLFLDEIGDMSFPMQVKLLRVLQERTYERLGTGTPLRCNVRIIAATHRDLEKEMRNGTFREDLFHRLNVFPVELPPLRERREDLPALMLELNARARAQGRRTLEFSPEALDALTQYPWPGNIRELANLLERLSITRTHGVVQMQDLPAKFRGILNVEPGPAAAAEFGRGSRLSPNLLAGAPRTPLPPEGLDLRAHLADIERTYILEALECSSGVIAHAAQLLRLQHATLKERMNRLGVSYEESEPAALSGARPEDPINSSSNLPERGT
jgi:sigma-54 dependent transcriptional regulator, flagellar regulatory protein